MAEPRGVALLLVSHSRPLAEATRSLIWQMTTDAVPVVVAAGAGDEGEILGTDTTRIASALQGLVATHDVVVLMDLGSALLSTEMALGLLSNDDGRRIRLCSAPFVEGAVAAALAAQAGTQIDAVLREAESALRGKQDQLGGSELTSGGDEQHADPDMMRQCYRLHDPMGLHLRPAAEIVRVAGGADGKVWVGRAGVGAALASANSLSALLALELRQGEELCVYSRQSLAAELTQALAAILGSPPGEDRGEQEATLPRGVVPGFACGVLAPAQQDLWDLLPAQEAADEHGLARIHAAMEAVAEEAPDHGILAAQRALLGDPRLLALIERGLATGQGPAHAWVAAIEALAREMASLQNPVLRARAADWRDLGARVLRRLLGVEEHNTTLQEPRILLVDELLPSVAAALDAERVLGVVDRHGAQNSHAAILLRARGIPYIIQATDPALQAGVFVALDGGSGEMVISPDAQALAQFQSRHRQVQEEDAVPPGFTGRVAWSEGSSVELWANVASAAEAVAARRVGAFGIGLLRTEFLYLDQWQLPSEEDQAQRLREILLPMADRTAVVRLLDAGADKPMAFLVLPSEENPALGLRGIRALLARKDFLHSHLRAILRAGEGLSIQLLLPMVTNPEEVQALRQHLAVVRTELLSAGVAHGWPVPVGVMAEVPAMLLAAENFRSLVDFVSVGTNDLTQYVLAADRGDDRLQNLGDARHPAVLTALRALLRAVDRPVSVCGEAAGDPLLVSTLVAAGIRRLSMSPDRFGGVIRALQRAANP